MYSILIMMLFNIKTKTYHPIFYCENPLPSDSVIRFKSKGHRTNGFLDIKDAIDSIQTEVIDRLDEGTTIYKELKEIIEWNGNNIPIDIQLRTKEWKDTCEKLIKK